MSNLRQAAEMALVAMENLYLSLSPESVLAISLNHRITDLRAALAEQNKCIHGVADGNCKECYMAAEPVAWLSKNSLIVDGLWETEETISLYDDGGQPLYTATQLAAARQQGAEEERKKGVNLTHTPRQHVTDGQQCWCNPELDYKDPVTGVEVWIHKEPQ